MSRLPTLSTPGRSAGTSPASGIPAPSIRRPRSSLGPGSAGHTPRPDAEMNQALKDVLRRRPPSSLGADGPETPTPAGSNGGGGGYLTADRGLQAPRTPGLRPRTPSSATATPTGIGRAGPRPSLARSLAASSSTAGTTPRRVSAAASNTTPYRRPESRTGTDISASTSSKWTPQVGDLVRLPNYGYEGTVRYMGQIGNKEGIYAGVELQGGFSGKGRNDGSVDGVQYFETAPRCGIFTLVDKLARPTSVPSGPSRPGSVASHRSLASSHSASGRATPSAERTRRGATTPSAGTRPTRKADADDDGARRAVLANSSATNAARAEARITAGSRASKYLGLTAKELSAQATDDAPATTVVNTSQVATPRVSKFGMGSGVRSARPSLGGLATPKARAPRMSSATDAMPPPPSPQASRMAQPPPPPSPSARSFAPPPSPSSKAQAAANTAALEEEIKELRRRNAQLEDQVNGFDAKNAESHDRILEVEAAMAQAKDEAEALRQQLSSSTGDAEDVRRRSEELQATGGKLKEELDATMGELEKLKKEMKLELERAAGELEASMEAKREELRVAAERAEAADSEIAELKAHNEQLMIAGNQIIELSENKAFAYDEQIRELESKLQAATDEAQKANERAEAAATANGVATPREATAAEIDNETLTAQVAHLQNRISVLEEQLDEARGQAESDSDAWQAKYTKARDSEKTMLDELQTAKERITTLNKEAEATRARIAELQGALKESQTELEGARAEIESLRADATAAESTRAMASDTKIADLQDKLTALTDKRETEMAELQVTADKRAAELQAQVSALERQVSALKNKAVESSPKSDTSERPASRAPRSSTGSVEAEKSIRGYRHIVNEMKEENSQLSNKNADLLEEIAMLKEEIKLLQDINAADAADSPGTTAANGETEAKLRAQLAEQAATLKEYEREVSELESLIESKIYHEDELETRLANLEAELASRKANGAPSSPRRDAPAPSSAPARSAATNGHASSHARSESLVSSETAASGESTASVADSRCELCEGPHELDACPVFSGETLVDANAPPMTPMTPSTNMANGGTSPLNVKKKKWCNDCESSAHDTAECPMADDVF